MHALLIPLYVWCSLWVCAGTCGAWVAQRVFWLHVQVSCSPCLLNFNQNLKNFLLLKYGPGRACERSPILISWFKGRIMDTHAPSQANAYLICSSESPVTEISQSLYFSSWQSMQLGIFSCLLKFKITSYTELKQNNYLLWFKYHSF